MEYRDLYDEFGILTGETVQKGIDYPENRRVLVAAIVISNDNNELLIQKRSIAKAGDWAFTSGHIESKESCIDGMIREVKEELGIKIPKNDIIMFNSGVNEKYVYVSYFIKNNVEISKLKLQKEEVSDAKWLKLEEIKELIQKGKFKKSHINIFNDYLDYIKNYELV